MDSMIEFIVSEDAVRARAYALWESEGRPLGRDAEHWRRSEEEFMRLTAPAPRAPAKAAKPRAKKVAKKG
jgi:hypothetical protein